MGYCFFLFQIDFFFSSSVTNTMVNGEFDFFFLAEIFQWIDFSVFVRWIDCLRAVDDLYVWIFKTCAEVTRMVSLGKERICWHFLQRFVSIRSLDLRLCLFSSVDYWHSITCLCGNLMCSYGILAYVSTMNISNYI